MYRIEKDEFIMVKGDNSLWLGQCNETADEADSTVCVAWWGVLSHGNFSNKLSGVFQPVCRVQDDGGRYHACTLAHASRM